MSYPLVDVSGWTSIDSELSGATRDKFWLAETASSPAQDQWLFKPVKQGHRPGVGAQAGADFAWIDHYVERIGCELARLIDLPSAQVELAVRNGDDGCISRSVIPADTSRRSGDTLLSDLAGYEPLPPRDERGAAASAKGHTLSNIGDRLAALSGPPGTGCADWPAFSVFAGYLVFDAWIANTDRHAENWAVLDGGEQGRLAASFDHGRRCPLVDLAHEAVRCAGPEAREWIERIGRVRREDWQGILDNIEGLSVAASTFMDTLLEENQRRLCR